MESISDDFTGLRCRLCFHAGSNGQLIEVFDKNHDLSKRVLSALGVKVFLSQFEFSSKYHILRVSDK